MKSKLLPATGRWSVQILDALNGAGLNNWPQAYVWGRVEKFVPGDAFTLLVETFEQNNGSIRFDQSGHSIENFTFNQIVYKT